jgi:NADH-quinone oxidoreductase subunit J
MGALLLSAETPQYLPHNIAFGVMAVIMTVSAIRVVTTKNVVHAALWLVIVLAGVAGIFILAGSEFVAVTQILVYIGAIVVLFLFGIMLTRAPLGTSDDLDNNQRLVAVVVALLLFGLMGFTLWDTWGTEKIGDVQVQTTAVVSDSIFTTYLLPFEAVSVLLLAALIGAIVLARRD